MEIEVKIERIFNERDTETVCITSDVEEAVKVCKLLQGDFNVTVWINGEFLNTYMDMDENEIRELFSKY